MNDGAREKNYDTAYTDRGPAMKTISNEKTPMIQKSAYLP